MRRKRERGKWIDSFEVEEKFSSSKEREKRKRKGKRGRKKLFRELRGRDKIKGKKINVIRAKQTALSTCI